MTAAQHTTAFPEKEERRIIVLTGFIARTAKHDASDLRIKRILRKRLRKILPDLQARKERERNFTAEVAMCSAICPSAISFDSLHEATPVRVQVSDRAPDAAQHERWRNGALPIGRASSETAVMLPVGQIKLRKSEENWFCPVLARKIFLFR